MVGAGADDGIALVVAGQATIVLALVPRLPRDLVTWPGLTGYTDVRVPSSTVEALARMDELCSVLPPESSFLLADEDEWGTDPLVEGRRRIPFPEQEGVYWGRPADDEAAVAEFDRQRDRGADAFVVAWPAFWWLQHYRAFSERLRTSSCCLLDNERIVVFDLRST